tara:strand:+ start:514 stop:714 length:201 start_codon:yes stop_codon:yes gene_type:complete
MIQVSKVKNKFHDNGLQISPTAMNMIQDDFNRKIQRMIDRCKEGNVKRLTDKTYHISIGVMKDFLK